LSQMRMGATLLMTRRGRGFLGVMSDLRPQERLYLRSAPGVKKAGVALMMGSGG
jgi:hypothetical protein